MNIHSATFVTFSPTGTTNKIVKNISKGINLYNINTIDITHNSSRQLPLQFHDELVILATPVYYGRVPEVVASYLSTFEANKTPAILVVVYGNRAYDDALRELYDIAVMDGFIPLAGGVFVAEHSYSSSAYPIAENRPDEMDILIAQEFGFSIREKIKKINSLNDIAPLVIPGKTPYTEPVNLYMIKKARSFVDLTPETDPALCTKCRKCIGACPNDAISMNGSIKTDKWKCLICYACIRNCPEEARHMNDPNFQTAKIQLHQQCQKIKEPEFYF